MQASVEDLGRLRFQLRRAALQFLNSPERDNRSNALEILSRLAVTDTDSSALAEFLYAAAREVEASVLTNSIEQILKAAPQIPEGLSHYFHYAFLRTGLGYSNSTLFKSLPAMIRLQAVVHENALDVSLVSPRELIAILDRRLHALFETAEPPADGESRAGPAEIDVDQVVWDLSAAVRTPDPELEGNRQDLWVDVLGVLEYLISQCERLGGGPFLSRGFDERVKLLPLLMRCRRNPALQDRVHDLYLRTCQILRYNPARARYIAAHLEFLNQIERGENYPDAERRYHRALDRLDDLESFQTS